MNKQLEAAKQSMIDWLSHPNELGKKPYKIECDKEFDLHELHYYIFKFKEKIFDEWKLAVCGGYENDEPSGLLPRRYSEQCSARHTQVLLSFLLPLSLPES